jgi:hypothetical protein
VAVANAGVTNSKLANPSLTVSAGSGLTGGGSVALGGSTTLSIATAGVTNSMLQNSSLTVATGAGLSGGGTVALGGTLSLSNTGVLSVGAAAPLTSSGGANPSISLGTVPIANGGTGITAAPASAGQYLRSSGAGTWAVGSIQAGDVPSLSGTYVDLVSNQSIGGNKSFSQTVNATVTTGTAVNATSSDPNGVGLFGVASDTTGTGIAIGTRGRTASPTGAGVLGETTDTSPTGTPAGVQGQTSSPGGWGVLGIASDTSDSGFTVGVQGKIAGPNGYAVNGVATDTTGGTGGTGSTVGVRGVTASPNGIAILGRATSTTANAGGIGVNGRSDSPNGSGIRGFAADTTGTGLAIGVLGLTSKISNPAGLFNNSDANCTGASCQILWGQAKGSNVFRVLGNGAVQAAAYQDLAGNPINAGTVTSVGLSAPADFTVSGSPVTNSGTLALAWGVAPTPANTPNAIVKRDGSGNFSAGAVTATSFSGDGSALTNVNASQLGGQPAANYARLDIGNSLHGLQFINAGGLINLQDGQVNASITGNFTFALDGSASGTSSEGVRGDATGPSGAGVAGFGDSASSIGGLFVNTSGGKIISGQAPFNNEVFSIDGSGNLFASGTGANTIVLPNEPTIGTFNNGLAKVTADNPSKAKASIFGDKSGMIGIVVSGGGQAGSATIVVAGRARCIFENAPVAGDYVTIGRTFNAECFDAGPVLPTGEQVVGRALQGGAAGATVPVVLFGPEDRANAGTVTSITGTAPITVTNPTTTPNISIATGGITNAMLATNSVDSSKIIDGSIVDADVNVAANIQPGKIAGTAATLNGPANIFTNAQTFNYNTTSPGDVALRVNDSGSGTTVFLNRSGASTSGTVLSVSDPRAVANVTTMTIGNASHSGFALIAQATDSTAGADGTAIAGDAFGAGGVGVHGEFSNATGNGTAVGGMVFNSGAGAAAIRGQAFTAGSVGGVFQNTAGGQILSGQNNGGEVFSVDNAGNVGIPAAAITISLPNANQGGIGTTLNHPATLDNLASPATALAADQFVNLTTPIGIVIGGAGTSGNATIAVMGQVQCVFDGATTAGDYVIVSSTVNGGCHDSAQYPNDRGVLGRVLTTNGGAGTYSMILFGSEQRSPGFYDSTGFRLNSGHTVTQQRLLFAGTTTETFSGAAAFSGTSTYNCIARDTTTPANPVTITYNSGSSITLTGVGTDLIRYSCTGN